MLDTAAALVGAYVEFEAAYGTSPIDPRKKTAREGFHLTGMQQDTYDDLLADPVRLQVEMEQVLAQAARRLANKIAYNVK
jgi:hypothetical protein